MKQQSGKNYRQNRDPKPRNQKDRRPRRRRRGGSSSPKPQAEETVKHVPKRYGVVFYDNHAKAKEDAAQLLLKAKEVDQLNIVIKAEGSMDDPELLQYGKVYAGEAWTTIHKRREEDGWYNEPH